MNAIIEPLPAAPELPPSRPAGVSEFKNGRKYRYHWGYVDGDGCLLGYAVRYDSPSPHGKKQVLPFFDRGGPLWVNKAAPRPRPLYGLDKLPTLMDTDVLYVVEGEKAALALNRVGCPCVTWPGGSKAVAEADWTPLRRFKHIRSMPDNDEPGEECAEALNSILRAQNPSVHIEVVRLPGLPEKGDIVDWLQLRVLDWDGFGPIPREPGDGLLDEFLEAVENCIVPAPEGLSVVIDPGGGEPMPLRRDPAAAAPYPTDALGEVLGPAAETIARIVQVAPSIAGNSVLAGASLAVQAQADVKVDGRVIPLSVYALTIADSGDRKSSADRAALEPHEKYQRKLLDQYGPSVQQFQNDLDIYEKERKSIVGKSTNTSAWKLEQLQKLGPLPTPPPQPLLLVEDFTPEGVRRVLLCGLPSLGLFSDEGGRVVGGHAMLPENLVKTLAILSNLWDAKGGATARGGEGIIPIYGKRVSLHLMMQPSVAPSLFANPQAQGQGFLWRCLAVWPQPLIGRRYLEANIWEDADYLRYYARILSCLEAPQPLKEGTLELNPRPLSLSAKAKKLYIDFYNEIEEGRTLEGPWANVAAFAARIPEHALRLAGVLTLIGDLGAAEIGETHMGCGILLARWYLGEGLRIVETGLQDPQIVLAEGLLEWMRKREQPVRTVDVYQRGPNALRTAADARPILEILRAHNLITLEPGSAEAWRVVG